MKENCGKYAFESKCHHFLQTEMKHAASQKGIMIVNNTTAGCRTPKLFPSLCDDAWTAAPEGHRQVYALEAQPELSARDEEEISAQTLYPYTHLLQCFCTFLAGRSEQLLQEPGQSSGRVLGTALPLFPHLGSASRHTAQVSCTPEGTLSREQGREGFSWERTPPSTAVAGDAGARSPGL